MRSTVALREEDARRAGLAVAYREAAGITGPDRAVTLEPHRGNRELEDLRNAVFTALEIRDEADIIPVGAVLGDAAAVVAGFGRLAQPRTAARRNGKI
jgi:hypothetical protein